MDKLSQATGVPDPVLRLLVSLLSAYLYGFVYRQVFIKSVNSTPKSVWPRHLFNFLSGLSIAYFNYGNESAHFIVVVSVAWLLMRILGPTVLSASAVFIWAFGYLMSGYVFYSTNDYDINWTTSYCVMCLRVIGFAMDYYDGAGKKKEKMSQSSAQKSVWDDAALSEMPGLLETFGYCFFFGGFLVGPQFPFHWYKRFVTMKLFEKQGKISVPSGELQYAARCFLGGVAYLAVTQIGNVLVPTAHVLTPAYLKSPFWDRFWYMFFSGRIVMTKYFGIWLFNEGSCVISGISFSGHNDKDKKPRFDALTNCDPSIYEFLTGLSQVVLSFNMNTNLWCKNYVFKRLRFLGNKNLSALFTLLFLAIWHGFQFGYFACFITEFLDIEAERKLEAWTAPFWSLIFTGDKPTSSANATLRFIGKFACHFLAQSCLSYATVAFDLLTFTKITTFWQSMFWFGHIGLACVFGLDLLLTLLRPKSKSTAGKTSKRTKNE